MKHATQLELARTLAKKAPLDFTIQYPPSRRYFQQNFRARDDATSIMEEPPRRLLLYAHVPFCEQRCFYCNFAVDLRKSRALHERYIKTLCDQIEAIDEVLGDTTCPGIDIGGGTPTRVDDDLLELLMTSIGRWRARLEPGAQTSIETTPSIAAERPEKLALLARMGVDRVSVGLQSTNAATLASVNRRKQLELGERALQNLLGAGFDRVSVDLVFGLPGQTEEHFACDVERVCDAAPDAITIYDCLYRGHGRVLPKLDERRPSPADYARMYDAAFEQLTARGYHGTYGGHNFSRHPKESGTSSYFEGRLARGLPYLGAGNYSSSMIGPRWFFAPYEVDDYIDAIRGGDVIPEQHAYDLPDDERWAKHILAGLNFGVIDAAYFEEVFGVSIQHALGAEIEDAIDQGMLVEHPRGWSVAPGAFARIYELRALFYSARALDWVDALLTR